MSGHCDFCGIWHSGSCCHPARVKFSLIESDLAVARRKVEAYKQAVHERASGIATLRDWTLKISDDIENRVRELLADTPQSG